MVDRDIMYLDDIDYNAVGEVVAVKFVLYGLSIKNYKSKPGRMAVFNMYSKSVNIKAQLFDIDNDTMRILKDKCAYNAICKIKSWNGSIVFQIMSIEPNNDDISLYASWADGYKEATKEISLMLNKNKGTDVLIDLTFSIVKDNWDKLKYWTAAMHYHHDKLGGLIVHTYEVVKLSLDISKGISNLYEIDIDNNLIMCSAVLHDIGKIKEIKVDLNTGYTEYYSRAVLENHIMKILSLIDDKAHLLGIDENEERLCLLKHCIASHHGKYEYGSSILPSIPEAHIIAMADLISANFNRIESDLRELKKGEHLYRDNNGTKYTLFKAGGEDGNR